MLERLLHLVERYPLNLVSHLSSVLPICLGLAFRNNLPRSYTIALLLFGLYFIADSVSLWLVLRQVNTYPVQNAQPLLEIWIVAAIYISCFENPRLARWIKITAALCSFMIIVNYQENGIATISLTAQRLFVAVLVLLYFNKVLTESRIKNMLFHSMFWISSGLLIYSAGTFFFSLFSSYLYSTSSSNEEFDPFWKLNQLLYIILCLLTCVGIWVCRYDADNVL